MSNLENGMNVVVVGKEEEGNPYAGSPMHVSKENNNKGVEFVMVEGIKKNMVGTHPIYGEVRVQLIEEDFVAGQKVQFVHILPRKRGTEFPDGTFSAKVLASSLDLPALKSNVVVATQENKNGKDDVQMNNQINGGNVVMNNNNGGNVTMNQMKAAIDTLAAQNVDTTALLAALKAATQAPAATPAVAPQAPQAPTGGVPAPAPMGGIALNIPTISLNIPKNETNPLWYLDVNDAELAGVTVSDVNEALGIAKIEIYGGTEKMVAANILAKVTVKTTIGLELRDMVIRQNQQAGGYAIRLITPYRGGELIKDANGQPELKNGKKQYGDKYYAYEMSKAMRAQVLRFVDSLIKRG